MNHVDYLLVCLIEEASEVQKAATKALRFGLDDFWAKEDMTNRAALQEELHDLEGIILRLISGGVISMAETEGSHSSRKAGRFNDALRRAEKNGRLAEEALRSFVDDIARETHPGVSYRARNLLASLPPENKSIPFDDRRDL